jgi:hypothetical protein
MEIHEQISEHIMTSAALTNIDQDYDQATIDSVLAFVGSCDSVAGIVAGIDHLSLGQLEVLGELASDVISVFDAMEEGGEEVDPELREAAQLIANPALGKQWGF